VGGGDGGDRGLASEQAVGHREVGGGVVLSEGKCLKGQVGGERVAAAQEVGVEAEGAAVAVLGGLGEQLEDDVGEDRWERGGVAGERGGGAGDVGVDELERIAGERRVADEHLVEGGAERVEVAAVIDGAVHPAGLLGGDVREGALEHGGAAQGGELARDAGGDAEVDELDAAVGVDEDVARLDVLVDDAAAVDLGEDLGELHGDVEAGVQRARGGLQPAREVDAGDVAEHEGEARRRRSRARASDTPGIARTRRISCSRRRRAAAPGLLSGARRLSTTADPSRSSRARTSENEAP
jgi:hypothetical protein